MATMQQEFKSYRAREFWEMIAMAAIMSGRANGEQAAQIADKLVQERAKRFPEEHDPRT